jgi:DNA repair protein RecN (Recombination protein N)
MRTRLGTIENREEHAAALESKCQELEKQLLTQCKKLHKKRAESATSLATEISCKLGRLGFAQSTFEIVLADAAPGPTGSDRVEFCFAPNPGEDTRPLRKIASSGEIARLMLAIKTVLSASDQIPILIFDEVDANIGGRVATSVAAELAAIGGRHQVLCITHLPQIAAVAGHHYLVGKQVVNNRTITDVTQLGREERITELSRMMGATGNSETARRHAIELLENTTVKAVGIGAAVSS